MLKITYDPNNGVAVPDGKTAEWTDAIIAKWIEDGKPETDITIGSSMIVDQFRVRVVRGVLDASELVFLFEHWGIYVYGSGRCTDWPRGFCDYTDALLWEILDAKQTP